jgi:hypothetical protein
LDGKYAKTLPKPPNEVTLSDPATER